MYVTPLFVPINNSHVKTSFLIKIFIWLLLSGIFFPKMHFTYLGHYIIFHVQYKWNISTKCLKNLSLPFTYVNLIYLYNNLWYVLSPPSSFVFYFNNNFSLLHLLHSFSVLVLNYMFLLYFSPLFPSID